MGNLLVGTLVLFSVLTVLQFLTYYGIMMTVLTKSFAHVLSKYAAARKTHKSEKNGGHTVLSSLLPFPPKQRTFPSFPPCVQSFQQLRKKLKIICVVPCLEEEVELEGARNF